MAAYVIVQYTIKDPKTFAKYGPVAGPTVAQYGGKMLVGSRDAQILEGKPHQVTVVIEFESVQAAQRWYTSPEYQAARAFRTSSTEGWALIAPQIVVPRT